MKANFSSLETLSLGSLNQSNDQDFASELPSSLVRLQFPSWDLVNDTHTISRLPFGVFANLDELEVGTIDGLEHVMDLQNHAFADFFPIFVSCELDRYRI